MKLYIYSINDFSKNEYDLCFSAMTDERKQSVMRYRKEDDRRRTVLGEYLAKKGISEALSVSENEITFERDENGRPFAKGLDIDFSISHSGELVVCAVSKKRIGVDIEMIRPINLRVTKISCTEAEKGFVFAAESKEEQALRFYRIWTAKEAYFKHLGTGIKGLKTVEYEDLKPYCEVIFENNCLITVYEK